MYVIFLKDFDYTWPSRAVTAYKKGYKGRVKTEVAEAAVAAGAAEEATPDDEAPPAAPTLPGNLSPALAVPDALTPNQHVAQPRKST